MKRFTLILAVVLAVGALATSAFVTPLSVRNGILLSYDAGKSMSMRGFDHATFDYNLTSKTMVLPSSATGDLKTGAQVTVFAKCYSTTMTAGCNVLAIVVRQPATGTTSAGGGSTQPSVTPTATP